MESYPYLFAFPLFYYFNPTTPQWSGIGWWDLSKALRHLCKATFHVVAKLPSSTYTLAW